MTSYRTLCFGDSNTWGYIPGSGARFDEHTRWPRVLETLLNSDEVQQKAAAVHFSIIEDGVSGRTTRYPLLFRRGTHGSRAFPRALRRHEPLDLVILALGINDLKSGNAPSAAESARGLRMLLEQLRDFDSDCRCILLAPPPLGPTAGERFKNAHEQSRVLADEIRALAQETGCYVVEIASLFPASSIDGIHFDADSHRLLAQSLALLIRVVHQQANS